MHSVTRERKGWKELPHFLFISFGYTKHLIYLFVTFFHLPDWPNFSPLKTKLEVRLVKRKLSSFWVPPLTSVWKSIGWLVSMLDKTVYFLLKFEGMLFVLLVPDNFLYKWKIFQNNRLSVFPLLVNPSWLNSWIQKLVLLLANCKCIIYQSAYVDLDSQFHHFHRVQLTLGNLRL